MIAVVTGANGFVGTALVAELERRNVTVIRATRANVGDLDGATNWGDVLRGASVVYHLAGRAHAPKDASPESFQRVNVDATRRLAEQCVEAGVQRLVFLSSIKVNGEESGAVPYGVDSEPAPLDIYGRSKLEAERALAAVTATSGLTHAIVRTPLVYGPGVKANFLKLVRAVDRGIPLPFGRIENQRSLTYVGNLCDALIHVGTSEKAAGRTYLVSDGEDVSTPELIRRIGAALGRVPRLIPVPVAAIRLAGALTGRTAAVRRLAGSLRVDSSALRRDGWQPPFTMVEGLASTAEWYRAAAL